MKSDSSKLFGLIFDRKIRLYGFFRIPHFFCIVLILYSFLSFAHLPQDYIEISKLPKDEKTISSLIKGYDFIDKNEIRLWLLNDLFTPIEALISSGNLHLIIYFLSRFTREEAFDILIKSQNFHFSPIHTAAMYGQTSIIEYLTLFGVSINEVKGSQGLTPLHQAAYYCYQQHHINTIKLLIRKGADLSVKDYQGRTPLDIIQVNNRSLYLEIVGIFTQLKNNSSKSTWTIDEFKSQNIFFPSTDTPSYVK